MKTGVAEKMENQTFVPTKEWQEIREGQAIPPGLHIRMDMQTGKNEAKLLDKEEPKVPAANNPERTVALRSEVTGGIP